ncbi:condensation domain-containing protein, partial [Pelagicoccus sp. SDUM812002]|uniref:condensation domain-containing protein n=1 Tax=Pelagicoccus sp. SDUM812002 TaxID=3041266 RepID=UPI0034E1E893
MNDIELLLNRLYSQGLRYSVENGKILFSSLNGKLSEEQKRLIDENRDQIKSRLIGSSEKLRSRINPVETTSRYMLSSAQRRLWVLSRFERGSTAYNMLFAHRFEGSVDVASLKRALSAVVARHESLRTRF